MTNSIARQIVDAFAVARQDRIDSEEFGWNSREVRQRLTATIDSAQVWIVSDRQVAASVVGSGHVAAELLDMACQDVELPETAELISQGPTATITW